MPGVTVKVKNLVFGGYFMGISWYFETTTSNFKLFRGFQCKNFFQNKYKHLIFEKSFLKNTIFDLLITNIIS